MIKSILIIFILLACKYDKRDVQPANMESTSISVDMEDTLEPQDIISDVIKLPEDQALDTSGEKKNEVPTSTPEMPTSIPLDSSDHKNESKKDMVEAKKETKRMSDGIPASKEGSDEIIANGNDTASTAKKTQTGIDHSIFNGILQSSVSNGKVDYKKIKDSGRLEEYLKILSANPVKDSWTRDEKLAYWINSYNAFTIKLILDNYPVKSITDLHGGKPWDIKWIELGGSTYSLNQIENDIIRPQFKEPRIHFAVNCAAISCPPLADKAYTASNLDALLEKQTRSFINNKSFNQITNNKVAISKIFEWYAADFDNLIDFLNKYADNNISSKASIKYNAYNWELNSL